MTQKNNKNSKSLLRRINDWLHLWLGIVSGIIIVIISITGCILVFQREIKDLTEPWRFVEVEDKDFVPPSQLLLQAQKVFPDKQATGLTYAPKDEAAAVGFIETVNGKVDFSVVFMNPYDASVVRTKTLSKEFDFFSWIKKGHRYLWLPIHIGRPIVGISTLIFLFLLISGIIMWWPKRWKKQYINASFKIKWKAKLKRLNYDLHNVLGFYSLIFAAVLAISGLFWSFQWFEKGLYYVTSGGEQKIGHHHPHSEVPSNPESYPVLEHLDRAWYAVMDSIGGTINGGMYITPEWEDADDPIEIVVYHQRGKYYERSDYFYDRYTLNTLRQQGDRYHESNFADKLSMLNYDIHVGAAGGVGGKILAFIISLISASLPITGFMIWWNRKMKNFSFTKLK